jgi:hypothetical protein
MFLPPSCFVAGSLLLATPVAFAKQPSPVSPAGSPVRALLHASLAARAPAPVVMPTGPLPQSAATEVVSLAPFFVNGHRSPSPAQLDAAMAQEKLLESHAAYKKDLTKRVRFEALLPPEPGKAGGFSLPVFRLSW